MAYDPVKAHEYYMEYKKKGKKKGRKKGKGKQTSLVGLSTAGLSDAGKMNWALTKESLQNEMNKALAAATSDDEKAKIREDFQSRALQALQKMKSDPAFAKAKASKTSSTKQSSKGTASSKSTSSKSTGSKTTSSKKGDTVKSNDISDDDGTTTGKGSKASTKKTGKGIKIVSRGKGTQATSTEQALANVSAQVEQLKGEIERLKERLPEMNTEKREELRTGITNMLDTLRKRRQRTIESRELRG